jgi:hypothetical protein
MLSYYFLFPTCSKLKGIDEISAIDFLNFLERAPTGKGIEGKTLFFPAP